MKIDVLSSCTDQELQEKLHSLYVEIFNCKVNKKFVAKSELGKMKFTRKMIARILTLLNKRKVLLRF